MIAKVSGKSITDIAEEWNLLAQVRWHQIVSGIDVTYTRVLMPLVTSLVENIGPSSLLDAGCGVGVLTAKLGKRVSRVIGIDPSTVSIEVANTRCAGPAEFRVATLEEFSASHVAEYDMVLANMVLMDTPNLNSFLEAARMSVKDSGHFVFTITHPCFWASYHGYAQADWFDYNSEIQIEEPFTISNDLRCAPLSTLIHRPLSTYFNRLSETGFRLTKVVEPFPDRETMKLYPSPWQEPRYLCAVCEAA